MDEKSYRIRIGSKERRIADETPKRWYEPRNRRKIGPFYDRRLKPTSPNNTNDGE